MEELKADQLQKSQAKKISYLIKTKKGLLKRYNEPVKVKEPVLWLIRRNKKVDYFEGATKGEFDYEHSDGDKRTIFLTENKLDLRIGNRDVSTYICHEDYPIPLPSSNMRLGELFQIQLDKALYDIKNLKIKEEEAKQGKIMVWFQGLALLAIAYILYILLKPEELPQVINQVQPIAEGLNSGAPLVRNATVLG